MKKEKTIRPYFFKDKTNEEVVDLLNSKYKISLKNNKDLVERVFARYPFVSKTQIAVIIHTVFSTMRELLVIGNILNFNGLFFDTKLDIFGRKHRGNLYTALRVLAGIPPTWKKIRQNGAENEFGN